MKPRPRAVRCSRSGRVASGFTGAPWAGILCAALTLPLLGDAGCVHGPVPKAILPSVRAPGPDDSDRARDGLRGPVQRVRTGRGAFQRLDEYDRAGRILHRVTQRLETWYRYDDAGRLVEIVERSSSLDDPDVVAAAPARRLSRQFDGAGRLRAETTLHRDGHIQQSLRVDHDAQGRRAVETVERENRAAPEVRSFHYDDQNRVDQEVVDDGARVTFVRAETPTRTWRVTYERTTSRGPFEKPPCPWPAELPLTEVPPALPPSPSTAPGGLKALPAVLPLLGLFGYRPGPSAQTLAFSECRLTVTDDRGYLLEETTPDRRSQCHRYNDAGDEIVSERRERGPGCGWMVTIQTPHDTTESKYEYDPRGNWIRRYDQHTTVDFPSKHGRPGPFHPLPEIMEWNRSRPETWRAITYFDEQP